MDTPNGFNLDELFKSPLNVSFWQVDSKHTYGHG